MLRRDGTVTARVAAARRKNAIDDVAAAVGARAAACGRTGASTRLRARLCRDVVDEALFVLQLAGTTGDEAGGDE